jgi:hypothetical protein
VSSALDDLSHSEIALAEGFPDLVSLRNLLSRRSLGSLRLLLLFGFTFLLRRLFRLVLSCFRGFLGFFLRGRGGLGGLLFNRGGFGLFFHLSVVSSESVFLVEAGEGAGGVGLSEFGLEVHDHVIQEAGRLLEFA